MLVCNRYHQYKFIVDGVWRHDEKSPAVPDPMGNVNNWVFVRKPVSQLTKYLFYFLHCDINFKLIFSLETDFSLQQHQLLNTQHNSNFSNHQIDLHTEIAKRLNIKPEITWAASSSDIQIQEKLNDEKHTHSHSFLRDRKEPVLLYFKCVFFKII